jgi:hypothetical protein
MSMNNLLLILTVNRHMLSWLHVFLLSYKESDKSCLMFPLINILGISGDSQLNGLGPEVTGHLSVVDMFGVIVGVW